jgi:DNA-binding NarL/FixJ family response regulator
MKKRIVFFDEDLVYGSIIDKNLRSVPAFVYLGWHTRFHDLLLKLKLHKPDFILMELSESFDLSIISEIKKSHRLINVIVVSSKDDHASIVQALKAGANGYLLKYLDCGETMENLKQLSKGGVALSPSVARSIVKGFWKTNNSPLTITETKVLRFVSQGHTYSSVAANLEISKGTAKTHLKNIYRKLNIHRKSEALERAYLERLI